MTASEAAKLVAGDAAADDFFGHTVSVSGSTALIGARYDDDNGLNSGSAYVFVRNGSTWTQQAKLTANDGAVGDNFGRSVAIAGDTALIGANGDGTGAGAAYVFVRNGASWIQQDKLSATDSAAFDSLGISVSISGDTALLGAHYDDESGVGVNTGSAYVFVRNGQAWVQQAKLTANDASSDDEFGGSVAIHGNTALIGAYRDDDNGYDSGSAYVFVRSGNSWVQQAKLIASRGAAYDHFAKAVSISGNSALIGAAGKNNNTIPNAGAAYVFTRAGVAWSQQEMLVADDADPSNEFGYSVSISDDSAVVGARNDNDNGSFSGSAYAFLRFGSNWTQHFKLTVSDGAVADYFGTSIAVSGSTVVAGAPFDDDTGGSSGSAYVFDLNGSRITIGLGSYPNSGGYVERVGSTSPYSNVSWHRAPWGAYIAANGETRPVLCDVDGNGQDDLILGLGTSASGYLVVQRDNGIWSWLNIPWSAYNSANGESYPACGDIDADGRDEIVVGLGTGGGGYAFVFDDANTNFAPLSGGWINLGWGAYGAVNGATHPAVGNLDGDAAEEIVLGTGEGGNRYLRHMGDGVSGLTPGAWVRAGDTGSIPTANHRVWPAICGGQLVLGASSVSGVGGQGWLNIRSSSGALVGWMRVPWGAYNAAVGSTYPACGNIDADVGEEIAVGLGGYTDGGFIALFDDLSTGGFIGWPRVHWADYNSAVGSTRPAMPQ